MFKNMIDHLTFFHLSIFTYGALTDQRSDKSSICSFFVENLNFAYLFATFGNFLLLLATFGKNLATYGIFWLLTILV